MGITVAGNERQALAAGVQPHTAEHAPDATLRDPQATPLGLRRYLTRSASRPQRSTWRL
jgi:hypothetical protein